MGQPYSTEYLDKAVEPLEWCKLRKAKIKDNTYMYVPGKPVEKGCYAINYSINGKDVPGQHHILIE